MSNRVLIALSLTLLGTLSASAQSIEARFSTTKATYLFGEPLFVELTVNNASSEPIWLDFQPTSVGRFFCEDFAIEVPGAGPADEPWGCGGYGGSCGRGLREVEPARSITVRQFVNEQFRLLPGAYSLHAKTTIAVRRQDSWTSPEIEQVSVSDNLQVKVERGKEGQLESAFGPIVAELSDPDLMKRAEAAAAITELAPPFLEDLLIQMTKTNFGGSAIVALRKVNTPKTRAALANIASSDDSPLQTAAIENLGRIKDIGYLPTLFQLMDSGNKPVENAAANAAGLMGGAAAIPRLSTFASNGEVEARIAGVTGLGNTHAREAVPILIGLLLDLDSNVRQAAVSGLWLLTHHAAFNGNEWADISTVESAAAVHQRWMNWWSSHGASSEIHGMADCSSPEPL